MTSARCLPKNGRGLVAQVDERGTRVNNGSLRMYRRSKFLEALLEIRCEMAREADYDVVLFAESARTGRRPPARRPQDSAANRRDLVGTEPDIIPLLVRSNDR
ncbi:MAG TPA: hypothetical protein VNA17_07755 [Pyrinomonadaceae bacterium]|nr:hypothetical protein [Pyrinomonadaceae bacterium]